MNSVVASRNLLMPTSTGHHPSADTTDWTGRWVCVGLATQLTEEGAVLPATIGYHATHVRRTADGLTAAVNARPFGGCASIPLHCGSTRNVRCPHRACAFSEDGDVLDGTTDPTGAARAEFVGDGRRTVTLPLAQWGPLLFVNVTMAAPTPLAAPVDHPVADAGVVAFGRRLLPGNWLQTPDRSARAVADSFGGAVDDVAGVAPNLAVVRTGSEVIAVASQPAGHTRSTITWALLRPPTAAPRVDPVLLDQLLVA